MLNNENQLVLTLPALVRVLMPNGQVEEMKFETYLAGAVAAEIGASAPLEALKAQAVAARTYVAAARRHLEHAADVCTTAHCQRWKRVDPVSDPEVFRALSETWGMVAVFSDNLINAFFFEHCDGHTRNAEEMHIPELPYLRGVDCSCGFLSLKGHGVGMCKRGAIVMARRGALFDQILQHYYRGIRIMQTASDNPAIVGLEETKPPRAPELPKTPTRRRAKKSVEPTIEAPKPAKPAKPERIETAPARVIASPSLLKRPALPKSVPVSQMQEDRPVSIEFTPIKRMLKRPVLHRPILKPPAPVEPPSADLEKVIEPQSAPIVERPLLPIQIEQAPAKPAAPAEAVPQVSALAVEPKPEPAAPVVEPTLVSAEPIAPVSEPRAVEAIMPVQAIPQVSELSAAGPAAFIVESVSTPITVTPEPTAVPPSIPEAPMSAPPPVVEQGPPASEHIAAKKSRRYHVDHLPGERMIAGNLSQAGIAIRIEDTRGNETIVFSGSATHYGAGGFETRIDENGAYVVAIDGKVIQVTVRDETVFICQD